MEGRDHALPDDVQALAQPVLAHRLLPAPDTVGVPADETRRAVVAAASSLPSFERFGSSTKLKMAHAAQAMMSQTSRTTT